MRLLRFLAATALTAVVLAIFGAAGVMAIVWHYGRDLQDYRQLESYEPPLMSRVHAGDGSLIAEFARERRLFVPVDAMPKRVIQAFLSAEDKTFYRHPGIDIFGVARAVVVNLRNLGTDRRPIGASTITQQVAKNFLLSNEVSLERKVKEAILAFRIEHALGKNQILELYLNEIYLGWGSYGVAAAALNYFDKSLDELTLEEAAFLAALPKAPNNYHPIRNHEAAVARRNWVLSRMAEDGHIPGATAAAAMKRPLAVKRASETRFVDAAYFVEEVRRELEQRYGEQALYDGGLSVRTSLDPELQRIAERALRDGLIAYDRRHGYRGPMAHLRTADNWPQALTEINDRALIRDWRLAVVLALAPGEASLGFVGGGRGTLPAEAMSWARPVGEEGGLGPAPQQPADVLSVGDVIVVAPMRDEEEQILEGRFALQQVPAVNGAAVAMDPHTGRVLAMQGGFAFAASQYNRASQALRQPGSAFKPFVYAAALDNGFTPASVILDAPVVIDQGELGKWKPGNYSDRFYGPGTLRLGIEKSRNVMTVRLAQQIGMPVVVDYARRFGITEGMPPYLPMALGAGETTLLRLTTAYSMLVNGGKRITPTLIDRIQDRRGRTVYKHDQRDCPGCIPVGWYGQPVPAIPDDRPQVIAAATAYQMVSMLEGVVLRGTGRRIASLERPLAGKTGTTNESRDGWFVGFSPDLAFGVYIGFDEPRSLGRRETGSSVAVPVFRQFMGRALADEPATPFRIPPGISLVRVDVGTGQPVAGGGPDVILEAFKPGTEPALRPAFAGDGGGAAPASEGFRTLPRDATPRTGTGGLY